MGEVVFAASAGETDVAAGAAAASGGTELAIPAWASPVQLSILLHSIHVHRCPWITLVYSHVISYLVTIQSNKTLDSTPIIVYNGFTY